jgi:hypothetical protein
VPGPEETLIALNPVIADRADDFEEWLRTVLTPAVTTHRPELRGRWEVLRAVGQEDGLVMFAFVLRGEERHDWELLPLLTEAIGADRAQAALQDMHGMMRGDQYGWSFRSARVS